MASGDGIHLLVDCFICKQCRTGRDSRRLDCKHCLCYQCLTKVPFLLEEQRIQCPICWQTSSLSSRGLAGLPIDKDVDSAVQIIDGSQGLVNCKVCQVKGKASRAHARCCTCDRALCDECSKNHLEKKTFSDHLIIRNLCKFHISEYTRVCLTCQSGLCLDCIESELHEDHDVCDISEAAAKIVDVLSTGRNIIMNKIHEIEGNIRLSTERSLDKLNERRRETEEKLDLCRIQLQESVDGCLDKRDQLHNKAVASAIEKQNQACSEASNVVNEIDNLTRDSKMNIISNLSIKTSERYKALTVVTSALSSPPSCPELGDDICTINKGPECGVSGICIKIGSFIVVQKPDYTATPVKQFKLTKLDGCSILNLWFIKPGPGETVIANVAHSKEATMVNPSGKVVEKYQTSDGGEVRGISVYEGVIYILSDTGNIVTVYEGKRSQVINLKPRVSYPRDMDTDGSSLVIVSCRRKLLRYSYEGDLLQEFELPGIIKVTSVVHPNAGTLYLVTNLDGRDVTVLRNDGDHISGLSILDNPFTIPHGVTMLPNGHILVAYSDRDSVTEFALDGSFRRHLLRGKNDLKSPLTVCVISQYIWVGCSHALYLYKYP